jgi:hypothetical protein
MFVFVFRAGVVRAVGIGIVCTRPVESSFDLGFFLRRTPPSLLQPPLLINMHTKKSNNKNKQRKPAPLPHDDA